MQTIKAKVLDSKVDEKGRLLAILQCNRRLPKKNEYVELRWGKKRSLEQNSLYWVYLNWLIDEAGLKEYGHFNPMALHVDLKEYFLAKKVYDKGELKSIEEATTTSLNKIEFGEYLKSVEDFMYEFFEISSAPFWKTYAEEYKL